ncbi:MAG: hypothetical protein ACLP8B_06285 [Xanthobacteraceae bacterium]
MAISIAALEPEYRRDAQTLMPSGRSPQSPRDIDPFEIRALPMDC